MTTHCGVTQFCVSPGSIPGGAISFFYIYSISSTQRYTNRYTNADEQKSRQGKPIHSDHIRSFLYFSLGETPTFAP